LWNKRADQKCQQAVSWHTFT